MWPFQKSKSSFASKSSNRFFPASIGQGTRACAVILIRLVFRHNAVRLQLHALACNLAKFMRPLALPKGVKHWSLTTLREKYSYLRGAVW